MKIFLDTANIDEIREGASWGVLDGVTTNPSLLAREKRDFRTVIAEICSIVNGPISAEIVSEDAEGIIREGREVASWHPNVVAKVAMSKEGLKATKVLSQEGIRVNMTLIFSPTQALLAAKAGAAMVSPFVGRLDDAGQVGMDEVRKIVQIFRTYHLTTEVLAASIRHPVHVVEAAQAGADISTIPFKVLQQMVNHPLTDLGIERFLLDWEKLKKEVPDLSIIRRK